MAPDPACRSLRPFPLLCGFVTCLFAILLVYSQTAAFAWDEGYHILAAQSLARGRRPYLDFFFPATPLNAYWNAAAMQLFGETWREVHALSALVTAGTILLAADFIYARFPVSSWRLPGAIAAALLIGLQATVIEYATTGQPYALCLFLIVGAFRVSILAVGRRELVVTAAAGLLASAAAAASLLVAPAPAVLLAWILRHCYTGRRLSRVSAFLAGTVVPFLPVLWLFARAPRQVLFNVFEYHLFYRRANWEDVNPHDWKVLSAWLTSPQALVLGLLAAAGMWFCMRSSSWDRARRAEFSLCGWLALAIGAELCVAHPTFEWYFVLVIPFLAILSVAGLYVICSQLCPRVPPWQPVALLLLVVSLGSAKSLYEDRNGFSWRDLEAVAREVDKVTLRSAPLWADEHVYFLTRRRPAEGTEVSYAEVIDLPAGLASSLHIVPLEELDRRAATGMFSTVSTCEESEQIEALDLPRLFRHNTPIGTCHVFWGPTVGGIR